MMSEVQIENYDRGWYFAELKTLHKVVCAIKTKGVNIFSFLCTSGQITIKFLLLDHMVKDISKFESLTALDASPYELYSKGINAAYRRTSKRRAMRVNEMVSSLDQVETNVSW